MLKMRYVRIVCAMLLAGMAAASAQDRVIAPLPSLAPLVEDVSPAVVNISVQGTREANNPFADTPFSPFFGGELPSQPLRGEGSGVIVDADAGYLLTNHHVIENADEIVVRLADGRRFDATVVGSDAATDLAVLQIESDNLSDIEFTMDNDLRVGDYVVAIGNPLGLNNTVTAGIVSGLGRGLTGNPDSYEDFIQTDASINVGNSGGALVNLRGELVGINSAIISQTGGNIGIGLAIPARMAVSVMDQIIEYGEVRRGLLGITMTTVDPELAREAEYGSTGALVTFVNPGSAAEAAGIQVDDLIVGINGARVENNAELRNLIGLMRPDDQVDVELLREGRRMTVRATLDMRTPEALARMNNNAAPVATVFDGVEVTPAQLGGVAGLRVVSVAPDSVAASQGLREGDFITRINRRRVATLQEAQAVVTGARQLIVQVQRGNADLLIRLR